MTVFEQSKGAVSITEAAELAKAALEEEVESPVTGFVDFSTQLHEECFAFDISDGKIAVCSAQKSTENHITLLDSDTLDEIVRYPITFPCTKLKFAPSDSSLLAGSSDAVRVWHHDAIAGVKRSAKLVSGRQENAPCTSFDWTGPNIISASSKGAATLYDVEKASEISSRLLHNGSIFDLEFRQSTQIFASGGKDTYIRISDCRTDENSELFKYHRPILRLRWKPETHMLAAFGLDESEVIVLDERKPHAVLSRYNHCGSVPSSIDFSNELLVTGCSDGRVFLFSDTIEIPAASLDRKVAQISSVDGIRWVDDRTVVMLSKRLLRVLSI
jgi:WD40 repeat protein